MAHVCVKALSCIGEEKELKEGGDVCRLMPEWYSDRLCRRKPTYDIASADQLEVAESSS